MREATVRHIRELIREKRWADVKRLLTHHTAPDIADFLHDLPEHEAVLAFRVLPRTLGHDVFVFLEPHQQEALVRALTKEESRVLLESMSPDDRTYLFSELPAPVTRNLLRLLTPEDRKEAQHLLGYPEHSVGRLMTTGYVTVQPDWSASHALSQIRVHGQDSETVNVVYVVDRKKHLVDDLRLRTLILADPHTAVSDLLDGNVTSLSAFADREEAVRIMKRHDFFVLPVVDSEGVLLGIITADDVLDVAEEEFTEDSHKGASVIPLGTSYRRASALMLYRRRIGWLAILIFVSLISSGVIAAFESVLQGAIALVFFIPLLMATAGNTGSQSATLLVRAIATDEVQISEWWRVFGKELLVGVLLGATLGAMTYFLGVFRADYRIGIIVGLTMVAIVLVANLLGATLPFILSKLRIDPAVASAPLITSLSDALGLLVYFGIATWVLGVF